MLYRVYVDEAGDRGISSNSSAYFVVSAVIVPDAADAAVRRELAALRQSLGRQPDHVLHFHKLTHPQKIKAAQDLATFSIAKAASVIICKRTLSQVQPAGNLAYISRPDPMYLWALRLLLERVSWFVRDNGGSGAEAIVTVSHIKRFRVHKLHSYREALQASLTEIHWPAFAAHPFRVASNDRVELGTRSDRTGRFRRRDEAHPAREKRALDTPDLVISVHPKRKP